MTAVRAVAVSIALYVAPAVAIEPTGTLAKILESGTITLGYRDASLPFSYLDDAQRPIGYSIDLCLHVVTALKSELKRPDLAVQLQSVTSSNRIPLLRNGTIDLECGSTTNSRERQKQVAFALTTFIVNVRMVVKKDSPFRTLADLDGKNVVTTSGTTSVQLLRSSQKLHGVSFRTLYGKDHAESFFLLDIGRAAAFLMDDVLIAGLVANSRHPDQYRLLDTALRTEPYAIMLRRDDPAFKQSVDAALAALMRSGEVDRLYAKWFTSPIPPRQVNLRFPMSEDLKAVLRAPNDHGI